MRLIVGAVVCKTMEGKTFTQCDSVMTHRSPGHRAGKNLFENVVFASF
jgi:hypothetical protein